MAQRLQQKRSSVAGRRPDNTYLEPGELAINTNASDPGLFFEGNDGSIVKAGPTAVSPLAPDTNVGYGQGENWLDTSNNTLKIFDSSDEKWIETLSPFLGGSEYCVFVGSEFYNASDAVDNDGSARPFASLNRACLEVARRSIIQGRDDSTKQGKYTIFILPGSNIARNEPGVGMQEFEESAVAFSSGDDISIEQLRLFNSANGGIPLPRGTSIVGLDPTKSKIHPTYYPFWSRDLYESETDSVSPRAGIFQCSGDSLVNRTTFTDKIGLMTVSAISGEGDEIGTLTTLQPHGIQSLVLTEDGTGVISGDLVDLQYPGLVSRSYRGSEVTAEGLYWAEPVTETTLRLRRRIDLSTLYRKDYPGSPSPGSKPDFFFSLKPTLSSHHRLSAAQFASESLLAEYYTKIQRAFARLDFGGSIDDSEVAGPEFNIVTDLPGFATPQVDNSYHRAPTVKECYLLSNYGMCGIHADGSQVGGLREFNVEDFTYRAFQQDPDVYEVLFDEKWISLKEATWRGLNIDPVSVTDEIALQYMISSVGTVNIRNFYRSSEDVEDQSSSGLTDPDSDTRHFSVLSEKLAAVVALDHRAVGGAVGYWAKDGGTVNLENSTIILGGEAILAEGFSGIGSMGGSKNSLRGFEITGIRRPASLATRDVAKSLKRFYLNSQIASLTANSITFTSPIDVTAILPYTLRPGTVIWASNLDDGTEFQAAVGPNGLSSDGLTLDATVSLDTADLLSADVSRIGVPYIRRFIDPRKAAQRSYFLKINNTAEDHTPPSSGLVLRYAENDGSNVTPLIKPGVQLDPGKNGGWNHVFSLHQCINTKEGSNPNLDFLENHSPDRYDSYYVSLNMSDSFGPWNSSREEPGGTVVTYGPRSYAAVHTDINDDPNMTPSEDRSVWGLSHKNEYLQPTKDAYQGDVGFAADSNTYPADSFYARGIKCNDNEYDSPAVVDYDDGSSSLGIEDPNNPLFLNPAILDPEASHSRRAMHRFLSLLGYNQATIDNLLAPQRWNTRDIPIAQFPTIDTDGYGLSVGNWAVEFNTPSFVLATGMVWDLPGHINMSKGHSEYRKESLGHILRFDSMRTSVWGGKVIAQGLNHLGETLPIESETSSPSNVII